jgi:hypothetical protein
MHIKAIILIKLRDFQNEFECGLLTLTLNTNFQKFRFLKLQHTESYFIYSEHYKLTGAQFSTSLSKLQLTVIIIN